MLSRSPKPLGSLSDSEQKPSQAALSILSLISWFPTVTFCRLFAAPMVFHSLAVYNSEAALKLFQKVKGLWIFFDPQTSFIMSLVRLVRHAGRIRTKVFRFATKNMDS